MLESEITVSICYVKKKKRILLQIKSYNWQQVVYENYMLFPLCSDKKLSKSSKFTLLENGEIVIDDAKIVETCNTFSAI